MAEETSIENKKEPKGNKQTIVIIVLGLLVVALGIALFMGRKTIEEKDESIGELRVEQLELKSDLQSMLIQYDTLNVENEQLRAEISAQQAEITDMLKQIERHKDDAYIISKLKREAATLRDIMKGYLATIDSLNTLNIDLRRDNEFLAEELSTVKTRAKELEDTKKNLESIVAEGSVLQATGMESVGIRIRNNGKQTTVSRAGRVDMIRTCANIAENRISPSGKKTIYLRIISPDGVVMDNREGDESRFDFEGVSGKYSVKRIVEYNNEAMDVCVFYNVDEGVDLTSGKYIVEMYESGKLIGKADFDLK